MTTATVDDCWGNSIYLYIIHLIKFELKFNYTYHMCVSYIETESLNFFAKG